MIGTCVVLDLAELSGVARGALAIVDGAIVGVGHALRTVLALVVVARVDALRAVLAEIAVGASALVLRA